MTNTYTITQVAQQTGLSTYTLRYYEDLGLIENIARASNGHRRYTDTNLRWINLIIRLRDTGMSIEDMQYFVSLYRQGDETGTERHAMLSEHRKKVEAQIDDLSNMLTFIDKKLAMYDQLAEPLKEEAS